MDQLKEVRERWRSLFSRAMDSLDTELAKETVDTGVIRRLLAITECWIVRIAACDEQIIQLLLTVDTSEEEYTDEFESQFLYSDKLVYCRRKIEDAMAVAAERAESVIESTLQSMKEEFKEKIPDCGLEWEAEKEPLICDMKDGFQKDDPTT